MTGIIILKLECRMHVGCVGCGPIFRRRSLLAAHDVGAQRGRDWRPMSEREMQPDAPTCNLR